MGLSQLLVSKDPPLDAHALEELVRRGRSGDADSFDALVDRYYDVTFRLALRMLRERTAAEDATQEIFLKAWRHLPRFRGASRFSTWLHAIAVNHCLNEARRRSREILRTRSVNREEDADEAVSHLAVGPGRLPPDWESKIVLDDAIRSLPEKLRIVLTLHYFADFTIREIASEMALPPSTVQTRLDAALARLGSALKRIPE